ncbi:hypothetical protein BDU57DRAFT_198324 [Ampelomyces quisqualis]|uniref:RING-type domain-containing protein n=1 Tax=Ampelomyces quisqualis TaxID=50730 RepID=A0A6A5QRV6_AMPQU|nr:hypothetical protein BDU57DRAFT_198324 [Ampelomyces quisqualis]
MSNNTNQTSTNMPALPSEAEFFLSGMLFVEAKPDDCPICTETLDSDVIKIVACGHFFHCACVLTWCKSDAERCNSCPMCRRDFYMPMIPTPSISRGDHQLRAVIMTHLRRRDAHYDDNMLTPGPLRDNNAYVIMMMNREYRMNGDDGLNNWELLDLYIALDSLGMRTLRLQILQDQRAEGMALSAQDPTSESYYMANIGRRRNRRAILGGFS